MDAFPIQEVVKVDDTVTGIGEGLNAGCWTVGVAAYSNYMDINTLDGNIANLEERLSVSRKTLEDSGAHYVIIDSIVDLPRVIDDINDRMK